MDDLRNFIDQMIQKYGPIRVLLAPYAILLALAEFGLLKAGPVLFLTSSILSFLLSVIIVIFLVRELQAARRRVARRERVINRLTSSLINAEVTLPYSLESWKDRVVISRGGHTVIEQWMTINVSTNEPLRVMWTAMEQSAHPIRQRDRTRIRVEVHSFYLERNGNTVIGASYPAVRAWDGDALKVYPYFDSFFPPGSQCRLYLKWYWPNYYAHLLEGGSDEVSWIKKRSSLNHVDSHLIFDSSCNITTPFALRSLYDGPEPIQTRNGDGSIEIRARYGDATGEPLPPLVGYAIERVRS